MQCCRKHDVTSRTGQRALTSALEVHASSACRRQYTAADYCSDNSTCARRSATLPTHKLKRHRWCVCWQHLVAVKAQLANAASWE